MTAHDWNSVENVLCIRANIARTTKRFHLSSSKYVLVAHVI